MILGVKNFIPFVRDGALANAKFNHKPKEKCWINVLEGFYGLFLRQIFKFRFVNLRLEFITEKILDSIDSRLIPSCKTSLKTCQEFKEK